MDPPRAARDGCGMTTTTTVRTDSGIAARVRIRPLSPADRAALAAAFDHLSEDTRRRRFGGLAAHLGERDLDWLTDIDHHRHEALVATAPGADDVIGVARYVVVPDDPRSAEVAVVVDDDWQGLGIGRRLVAGLIGRARAEGIARLIAHVATDNRRVVDWVARAGGVAEASDGDTILFGVALDRGAELRTAA
jgi:GNAT superfamily N-acetyltransferase